MSLSAVLKRAGHQTELLLQSHEPDFFQKVKNFHPDVICFSVIGSVMNKYYIELCQQLKKENSFISVFGGVPPTMTPDYFMENDGVDVVCQGEGDDPIVELVNGLQKGELKTNILNLYVKKDGKIYRNQIRNTIEDLDSLPFVDREILYKYDDFKNKEMKTFLSTRGCPFICTYCYNHNFQDIYRGKGKYVRRRSVKHVIDEIKEVRDKYGLKRLTFADDLFTIDKKWVIEFCKSYKEEINIPFVCQTRADLMDDDLAKALKEANCDSLDFAIESGNDHLRNDILKRNMTKEQIVEAARVLNKHKLKFSTLNLVGVPDEKIENAFETLELNAKCHPGYAAVYIYQPYAGLKLTEYAVEKGYLAKDFDDFIDYHADVVLNIENKPQFKNLHDLFSLGVYFPVTIPLIKKLVWLPPNPVFHYIGRGFSTYSSLFVMGSISPKFFAKRLMKLVRLKIGMNPAAKATAN
jgi:radical SAM superfamily enzyme YgiQ (UPF0313 family)